MIDVVVKVICEMDNIEDVIKTACYKLENKKDIEQEIIQYMECLKDVKVSFVHDELVILCEDRPTYFIAYTMVNTIIELN